MERVEFNYKTREKRREALERSFGENLYKKHAACACIVCSIYVPKYVPSIYLSDFRVS